MTTQEPSQISGSSGVDNNQPTDDASDLTLPGDETADREILADDDTSNEEDADIDDDGAPDDVEEDGLAIQETTVPRSAELYASSLQNACTAARIADDLRGQNIVVLDLTRVTSIVDFFVIATANSQRQMHAIADEVNRKLKREDGNKRISVEGYRTQGNWLLTDYGDVVLHVFTQEGRALYALEQLWADAGRIDWQNVPLPQAKTPADTDGQ
ncbi:MAG: ribosome silencing factor [Planctomycetaceae bacterium]|nr:ribosome silencing factor [Planctomycetaceae bacterium]